MTTRAYIVHSIAGRCRLRLPDMRGDAEFFNQLCAAIEAGFAGSRAKANPTTASVLLTGTVPTIDELRAAGREHQWFDLADERSTPWSESLNTPDWFGADDVKTYLTATFLALAAVQVMRGQIMVPATSFLMYALAASAFAPDSS